MNSVLQVLSQDDINILIERYMPTALAIARNATRGYPSKFEEVRDHLYFELVTLIHSVDLLNPATHDWLPRHVTRTLKFRARDFMFDERVVTIPGRIYRKLKQEGHERYAPIFMQLMEMEKKELWHATENVDAKIVDLWDSIEAACTSNMERRICRMRARKKTDEEIGDVLNIAKCTVHNIRMKIYRRYIDNERTHCEDS